MTLEHGLVRVYKKYQGVEEKAQDVCGSGRAWIGKRCAEMCKG